MTHVKRKHEFYNKTGHIAPLSLEKMQYEDTQR